jgi:hypothetical protein
VDVAHRVGLAEVEQVVVAPHVPVPVLEPLAAIASLVQLEPLDHGAHGAVEDQDTFGRRLPQGRHDLVTPGEGMGSGRGLGIGGHRLNLGTGCYANKARAGSPRARGK